MQSSTDELVADSDSNSDSNSDIGQIASHEHSHLSANLSARHKGLFNDCVPRPLSCVIVATRRL